MINQDITNQHVTNQDVTTKALEQMVATLQASGRYRVLRKLEPRIGQRAAPSPDLQHGVIVDVETTGTNPKIDEIIEIALLGFDFTADGRVVAVEPGYSRLREPLIPIPAHISALTGITADMTVGTSVNPAELADQIAMADLLIAHRAQFDRPFAEALHPAFADKPWGCSMTQVPWDAHGIRGSKLGYILQGLGMFHDAHRAEDDVRATLEILSQPLGENGRTGLSYLLEQTLRTTWRLRAIGARYECKDLLRARGYRWNNGDDGHARCWFADLPEELVDEEVEVLRKDVFGPGWQPHLTPITARDRFSDRV